MGRFAGNLALNMGTFGGVYIAGGIVPRFQEFFIGSGFRVAFEDKGASSPYLKDIPGLPYHPRRSGPARCGRLSAPVARDPSPDRLGKRFYRGSALIQWAWRRVGSRTQEDRVSQGM